MRDEGGVSATFFAAVRIFVCRFEILYTRANRREINSTY